MVWRWKKKDFELLWWSWSSFICLHELQSNFDIQFLFDNDHSPHKTPILTKVLLTLFSNKNFKFEIITFQLCHGSCVKRKLTCTHIQNSQRNTSKLNFWLCKLSSPLFNQAFILFRFQQVFYLVLMFKDVGVKTRSSIQRNKSVIQKTNKQTPDF